MTDGTPIGTGRLAPDGKIGRMAVLEEWRGNGVGAAILEFLVAAARDRGIKECRYACPEPCPGLLPAAWFREPRARNSWKPAYPHRAHAPEAVTWRRRDKDDYTRLETLADNRAGRRGGGCRREARAALFSRDLEPLLYDKDEFMTVVQALATRSRMSRIRIVMHRRRPLRSARGTVSWAWRSASVPI